MWLIGYVFPNLIIIIIMSEKDKLFRVLRYLVYGFIVYLVFTLLFVIGAFALNYFRFG